MKLVLKSNVIKSSDALKFVSRYSKWFFIALFISAFGAGLYEWYVNVYKGDWSDAQKLSYAESAFRETVLNENEFRKAVTFVSRRAESNADEVKITDDFFRPLPGMKTLSGS